MAQGVQKIMNVIFDSGLDDYRQNKSEASQTKIFEENNQLFKVYVSSYRVGEYTIYRFSESGKWELLEGKGGSFDGKISISFVGTRYQNGDVKKANWLQVWKDLEKQVKIYAKILPKIRETKSNES